MIKITGNLNYFQNNFFLCVRNLAFISKIFICNSTERQCAGVGSRAAAGVASVRRGQGHPMPDTGGSSQHHHRAQLRPAAKLVVSLCKSISERAKNTTQAERSKEKYS